MCEHVTSLPNESAPAGCSGEPPPVPLALYVVEYEEHLLHLKHVEEASKTLLIQLARFEGRTAWLTHATVRRSRLSIRHGRIEDQLDAAREDMQQGELSLQEVDAPRVMIFVDRFRKGEHEVVQAGAAPATADGHLQDIKSGAVERSRRLVTTRISLGA